MGEAVEQAAVELQQGLSNLPVVLVEHHLRIVVEEVERQEAQAEEPEEPEHHDQEQDKEAMEVEAVEETTAPEV